MEKIKGAFTIEHLQIAKMIAAGYKIKDIAMVLCYSKYTIGCRIRDIYARYQITEGNTLAKRKKLFKLLQRKHKGNIIFKQLI